MRAVGSRKKKLIVALHFQFSSQAGWECAACRKAGLAIKRRCKWIPESAQASRRVVWARNGVATSECPKTFITAQSMAWLETYLVRQRLYQNGIEGLSARDVEAFFIMEQEFQEVQHG